MMDGNPNSRHTFVDANGFRRWTCPTCGGVSHPSNGCVYTPTFVVCEPCTREFAQWIQAHTRNKGRRNGVAFYDHVNKIG